jgi:hypothetical protein
MTILSRYIFFLDLNKHDLNLKFILKNENYFKPLKKSLPQLFRTLFIFFNIFHQPKNPLYLFQFKINTIKSFFMFCRKEQFLKCFYDLPLVIIEHKRTRKKKEWTALKVLKPF